MPRYPPSMQDPIVIVAVIVLAGLLVAVPLLVAALRRLRRFYLLRGTLYLSIGAAPPAPTVGGGLGGADPFSYAPPTHEPPAGARALPPPAPPPYRATGPPR